jgi:hypothetical protein
MALRPVWTGAENLARTGIHSSDILTSRESPYQLSYPWPHNVKLSRRISVYDKPKADVKINGVRHLNERNIFIRPPYCDATICFLTMPENTAITPYGLVTYLTAVLWVVLQGTQR